MTPLKTTLILATIVAFGIRSEAQEAAQPTPLPSGGVSLIGSSDPIDSMTFRERPTSGGETIARRSVVPVADRPFDRAFRIEVFNPGKRFYDANIGAVGEMPVRKGDVALVRFQLRKIRSDDESGLVSVNVYVEGPGPRFSKSINTAVSAGDEWREFFLPFSFNDDYPAGQVFLFLSFGQTGKPMTMEIGGVELIHYGDHRSISELPRTRVTYAGSEPDAPWRAEADARIEAYRKGDFRIRLLDSNGDAVEGAAVRVEMLRHAFRFASVAQAARIMGTTEDDRIYREKLLELFNASGPENDTKWGAWVGEWARVGNYSQAQTLDALAWMSNHGLYLRGHVLVWPGKRNLPRLINDLLPDRDPSVPERVLDHIDEITRATKPFINEWDVLNEPYDNHDLMDIYGKGIMIDWFNRARANLPTAELYINDYAILSDRGRNAEHQQHLEDTVHYLIENGAPVTGIGMQGHIGEAPTEPVQLWKVLDRFATAFPDLKIMITEFDLNSSDEDFQADYTRDFMTMVFSHPNVVSIQNWGFWEGAHWLPKSAFYRFDWSEKPNLLAYRDLVFNRWWTSETGLTGSDGKFAGRGFLGRHRVTVTLGNQTAEAEFELTRESGEITVVLPAE
ncbi:MAG: endo-1,4-beta-xylanase [Opitutaceae bacterium]